MNSRGKLLLYLLAALCPLLLIPVGTSTDIFSARPHTQLANLQEENPLSSQEASSQVQPPFEEDSSEEESASEQQPATTDEDLSADESATSEESGLAGFSESPEASEPDEEEVPIQDLTVLNEQSVIVYSRAELETALSQDNGYTKVYLGADIDLTKGITIHKNKTTVLVDGVNPLDPEETVHSISDYANGTAGAIGIRSNNGTTHLTISNMVLNGKNYFGTFMVEEPVSGVTLVYENVTYVGPQITYNRQGTVRYGHGTSITIKKVPGGNDSGEVAECAALEFSGKVDISHSTSADSCFYLLGDNPSIKVLPGADVTVNIENRELFYCDVAASIQIGEYARLSVNSRYGVIYRYSSQRIGPVTIEEYGQFIVHKRELGSDEPVLHMKGNLILKRGAGLQLYAPFASSVPLIKFDGNDIGATFTRPGQVVLYNGGNAGPIGWTSGRSGHLKISAHDMSYWDTAAPLGTAGTLEDPPLRRWQRAAGSEPITVDASVSGTAYSSFSSNDQTEDGPATLDAGNFSLSACRVMAFGHIPLIPVGIVEGDKLIEGTTLPEATVRVSYRLDGEERVLEGNADAEGYFALPLPDFLPSDTRVAVTANKDFLTRVEYLDVLEPEGNLSIEMLPSRVQFENSPLSSELITVYRQEPELEIVIRDTRSSGDPWSLSVQVARPMSATVRPSILDDAFIFVDEQGVRWVLGEEAFRIGEGRESGLGDVSIVWGREQGILLQVNAAEIYTNTPYSGMLYWTLSDAP